MHCPKSQIVRNGYTRKSGSKKIKYPPTCIEAQSNMGIKRVNFDRKILTQKKKMHQQIRKLFPIKCKKGEIIKEGYKTKTRIVRPTCIKGTNIKGTKKREPTFVLQKGTLGKYGYHTKVSKEKRHTALKKAILHIKPLSVYRKLNILYILNKNRNPKLSNLFKEDAEWLKNIM
jgi:hypothetical protein